MTRISTDKATKLVNKFNSTFPVGSKCHWRSRSVNGTPYEIVTVEFPAFIPEHGMPVAFFTQPSLACVALVRSFVSNSKECKS